MIHIITFPRSGHHLLMNILFKYFSRDLDFPEIQGHQTAKKCKEIIKAGDLKYCELYNHCQKTGCTEEVDIQKNHDFGLKKSGGGLILPENSSVIVQVRKPVDAIISYYKTFRKTHNEKSWLRFYNAKLEYYKKFTEKWKDSYIIRYEDLLNEPESVVINALKYMGYYDNDKDFIEQVIKKMIRKPRNIKKFKYYNPKMESVNDKLYNFL